MLPLLPKKFVCHCKAWPLLLLSWPPFPICCLAWLASELVLKSSFLMAYSMNITSTCCCPPIPENTYLLNHIVGIGTIQNWSNRQGEWLSKAWCKPYPVWFLGWFHALLYDNMKVAGNVGLREVCPFWEVEVLCLNFYCHEQKFHDRHNWHIQQPLPPTVIEGHVLTGCPCSFSSFLPNAGSAMASQWAGTYFTNRCQTYIFLPLLFKELPFTGTFLQVLQDVLDDNRLKNISWDWHGYRG